MAAAVELRQHRFGENSGCGHAAHRVAVTVQVTDSNGGARSRRRRRHILATAAPAAVMRRAPPPRAFAVGLPPRRIGKPPLQCHVPLSRALRRARCQAVGVWGGVPACAAAATRGGAVDLVRRASTPFLVVQHPAAADNQLIIVGVGLGVHPGGGAVEGATDNVELAAHYAPHLFVHRVLGQQVPHVDAVFFAQSGAPDPRPG